MADFWYQPAGHATASGINLTLERALTAPVVMDCLTVLQQSVSALPHGMFERLPGGDKRRVENHPLEALFAQPDGECTGVEFIAQMVFDLTAHGNAIYRIEPGALGPVSRLVRMDPRCTRVERLPDGSRRWITQDATGRERRHVEGEVWHLRDVPIIDGLTGNSRLWSGREAIGGLISLQEYSTTYISRDATPPVVLKHPGAFDGEQSRNNFLHAISAWFGRNRKSPMVLEYGMEIERLGTTPEEGQFLETRKALQEEIARIWRMPPHKIGIMERATFSNIEHQAIEFVTDTLTPWLTLIEAAVNSHLVLNPRRYFFEFNVAGLLRGDIAARFEAYASARQWGWMSVNEIRRLENMNPIGRQGDSFLTPMNMTPAGETDPPQEARIYGPEGRTVSQLCAGEWRRAA